jgi:tRNA-dihydrouridine synthase
MAELSHRALRELIEDFGGCTEYFSEMISASGLIGGGPFERWYTDGGPCPERLVYQLVGSDPGQLASAAAILDRLNCLGIDLNMGCSAPAITRTGAGVRWMASIDRAAVMVGGVRRAVKRRLSVKLRIGLSESADFEYLVKFCQMLENEGVELITLHPRTAKEKFKRRPRWEYVTALRSVLGIPVAGNGDLTDAAALVRWTGEWDAVMAGRAAVRQPWVFAQAGSLLRLAHKNLQAQQAAGVPEAGQPEPPVRDLEQTALRFLELLARYQPPEFHLSRARRFFSYFSDNLTWGTYVKNLLNREQDLAGIERAWREYFAEHPEERIYR